MGKAVTYERATTMWQRAIGGSRRLGLEDVAQEYEEMGVDGYIERKGLSIINSANTKPSKRRNNMATKEELQQADDLLDDIWNALVDIDDDSTDDDKTEAIDKVCGLLNEFDDRRFPFDDDEAEEEAA